MSDPGPPGLQGQERPSGPAPPQAARAVPWGWLEAIGVFGLALALLFLVGGFLALALDAALPDDLVEVAFLPLSLTVLAATVVLWVRVRHPGATRLLGGPVRARRRHLWLGLAAGLVAYVGINLAFTWLLSLLAGLRGEELPTVQEEFRRAVQNPRTAPLFAVGAVVFAPVAEELFFRGMLFQALRDRFGLWPGIGLSAVAFSLAHIQWTSGLDANLLVFVIIFPLGMVLAWIFHRTGTLVTSLVTHAVFNASGVALMLAGVGAFP